MSKKFGHYFANANSVASEKFFSADGFDDPLYATGFQDEIYADGAIEKSAPAQRSQPYILQIANSTTSNITDVELLNPSVQIANGATPKVGITVTYGISGFTYTQFLYQLLTKPFEVGQILIESSSETQRTKTLTLKRVDANGSLTQSVLTPVKDPYQQSTTQTIVNHAFTVDALTSLIISTVLGSVTDLTIYLYPSMKLDVSKTLVDAPAISGYNSPNIVKGQKLVLSK